MKERLTTLCRENGVSVNDVVVRCLELGISSDLITEVIDRARTGPKSSSLPEAGRAALNLLWPPTLKERLTALCRHNGVTVSDFVVQCLELGLSTDLILDVIERARASQRPSPLSPGRPPIKERSAA